MKALLLDIKPARWLACKALGLLAPSVFWSRISNLQYREVSEPELPGPDWVRLRTVLGGICGTDLASITQRVHPASILRALSSFPAVLGHENVAVIETVGEAVQNWRTGDRVVVEPALSCVPRGLPPCGPCREGRFSLCERFAGDDRIPPGVMIGGNRLTSGSWASKFVAHQSQLHAVPAEVTDEQAVLVDPLASSMHGLLRRPPQDGERVLVLGGGIIGLGVVLTLRALGYGNEVVSLVRHEHQARRARDAGADSTVLVPRGTSNAVRFDRVAAALRAERVTGSYGNQNMTGGAEVVYDCVGTTSSFTDAMKFCQRRGAVVLIGTSHFGLLDLTSLWFSELHVVGANGRQMEHRDGGRMHTYDWVLELIRGGKLKVDGLLTHVYPLAEYRQALTALQRRGSSDVMKVAFRPDGH